MQWSPVTKRKGLDRGTIGWSEGSSIFTGMHKGMIVLKGQISSLLHVAGVCLLISRWMVSKYTACVPIVYSKVCWFVGGSSFVG